MKLQKQLPFLIIALVLVFGISLLFHKQQSLENSDFAQDWWALYFQQPSGNNASYVIENHRSNSQFRVQIYLENMLINESDVTITSNEKKSFPIKTEDIAGKKITITATSENQAKSITKTIN